MKAIKPGYEIINEPSVTKKIERIARICYKSEDKIADGTDIRMINDLIKRQHTAMLEHGSVVVRVNRCNYKYLQDAVLYMTSECAKDKFVPKKSYLRFTYCNKQYIVSGNVRAWYEFFMFIGASSNYGIPKSVFDVVNGAVGNIFDCFVNNVNNTNYSSVFYSHPECKALLITDFSKLSMKERMVHETLSVLFTVDRGITHELVRHRDCSFAQESTRYCNYMLDKFGEEITFIIPYFFDTGLGADSNSLVYKAWEHVCIVAEAEYFSLLKYGATPQQARDVLPTSVKSDIVVTATLDEWRHIFNLRACDSTGPAHPQMKEVMIPLLKDLRAVKYNFAFGNLIAADEVTA